MEAIEQKGWNKKIVKYQDDYFTLPAHVSEEGEVTTCWKLSWREKIKLLVTGKFFLQILTFNRPLQPLKMQVDNPLEAGK